MITVHTLKELRQLVSDAKAAGKTVGFVPTMGNLHSGHISLIDQATANTDFVVASIFVNPLQFNDKDDLARYPRTLSDDQAKLSAAKCDVLFAPDVDEMYPNGQEDQSIVTVPVVSEGLCGGSRPGHFDGVSTVVNKLFNMVQPDVAFFGQKDFQQVAVIKKMVADLNMPIRIVSVPIKRAEDGLALSSRNGYLSAQELATAPGLYKTLVELAEDLQQGQKIVISIENVTKKLNALGFRTDYIEVRRSLDLKPASAEDTDLVILAAAFLGNARLIDNIELSLKQSGE